RPSFRLYGTKAQSEEKLRLQPPPVCPNSKAVGPMKSLQGIPRVTDLYLCSRPRGAGWRSFRAATFEASRH
ncbi:MAG TPA: hypothetical protein VLW47_01040, partial [Thermodesulfobacteriota bacterium]|nr:hypothetical protein [Thermodesulfobacteriota bacterium]